MSTGFKIDRERLKPVPVGNSIWEDFSQHCYTVDKTLLVKELLDDRTTVALFTRPRRFGKTTALRMLKAFFEKAPKDTSNLFENFKIWSAGEKYRAEQGKYPVIYLTFKDMDGETFESAFCKIKMFVGSMVADHVEAIDSLVKAGDRTRLRLVMDEKGSVEDVGAALGLLAKAVHLHAAKALAEGEDPSHAKPIILIDEYDMPVTKASANGYFKEMTALMRSFLSGAMKDNVHVRMGIMTGVLRVAKEGILSGLNNPKVWTVFDERYTDYFGFREDEVAALASYYGVADRMPEIKSWYDGYDFGGSEIYNPWSVLNYFEHDCTAKPYWLDTSSNDLITEIVRDLPHDTAETLESLLGENAMARVKMTQELGPYAKIRENKDTLYALLVSSGYFKCCSPIVNGRCAVAIPNRELATVFVDDILSKVDNGVKGRGFGEIADALTDGNSQLLRAAIQRFLIESVSFFDNTESFFHGLTLGFLAILRDRYRVRSNRESGDGSFDIELKPLIPDFPGVIIEVKAAKAARQNLKKLAQEARRQIDEKNYAAEMESEGVSDIMKLGLAYYRKRVELAGELRSIG